MPIFDNDVGIRFRIYVSGVALTNVSSATLSMRDPDGDPHAYAVDSIDTSKTYVEHTKTIKTLNKSGTWHFVLGLKFTDNGILHANGTVHIEKGTP